MPSPPPTLRSRPNAPSKTKDASSPSSALPNNPQNTTPPPKPKAHISANEDSTRISLLDILRLLTGLLLLSATLSYFITRTSLTWNYRPAFTRPARVRAWFRGPLYLTDTQLAAYNGTSPHLPILLALNGSIYDVSASPHLYGPGGSYAFFAGRDATRAFVTGCFEGDLVGDLRGVEEVFMGVGEDIRGKGIRGKGEEKMERERARRKVREVVRGWERLFDGGRGGKYFRVGRVDRGVGSGWEGWGERRELCQKAKEGRPRRRAEDVR